MGTKQHQRTSRILLVDDHAVVRYGLSRLINGEAGLTVCGEAETADEALRAVIRLQPDLVILDLSLQGDGGPRLVRTIRAHRPSLPILIFSMSGEEICAPNTIRAGASGYVMKTAPVAHFIDSIRRVIAGELVVSPAVREHLDEQRIVPDTPNPVTSLSHREQQVFLLIGQGCGTQDIARRLHISMKTVETFRWRIKIKLGIEKNAHFVIAAAEWAGRQGAAPSVVG